MTVYDILTRVNIFFVIVSFIAIVWTHKNYIVTPRAEEFSLYIVVLIIISMFVQVDSVADPEPLRWALKLFGAWANVVALKYAFLMRVNRKSIILPQNITTMSKYVSIPLLGEGDLIKSLGSTVYPSPLSVDDFLTANPSWILAYGKEGSPILITNTLNSYEEIEIVNSTMPAATGSSIKLRSSDFVGRRPTHRPW